MIKWPEKVRNSREAGRLPGIGPAISAKLDEKLRAYQAEFGIINVIPEGTVILPDDFEETEKEKRDKKEKKDEKKSSQSKDNKNMREYVPTYRSAAYSILIALLLHLHGDPQNGPLNKSELALKAQGFCTSSLNDGIFPSINGALKTLEERELIGKLGNPAHWLLTAKGLELAEKLWHKGEKRASQDFLGPPVNPSRLYTITSASANINNVDITEPVLKDLEIFDWEEGSFEIVLLVDVREIRSREDRNYLTERLGQLGITAEVRNLELGDFIWIARQRNGGDLDELVLDILIERKREDDLIASISDGRFLEQKHRIARSQLSQTFYLVERTGTAAAHEFLGGAEERLLAATLQCQLIDGLMYRQTSSLDESITFLAALHKGLEKKSISGCRLRACDFSYKHFPGQFRKLKSAHPSKKVYMNYTAYALLNAKSINQSKTDIFLRQLMTVKGLTFDKACAIIKRYPTPLALHQFYQNLPNELAKEDAFRDYCDQKQKQKRFGVALSKKIYQVFGR